MRMKRILNQLKTAAQGSPPLEGCPTVSAVAFGEGWKGRVGSVGAIRDRALYSVGADGGRADVLPCFVGAIRDRADFRTLGAPRSPSSESGCEKLNSRAGFSLIEMMVATVLAIIVVWTAGTQIINVLRYHNEYRIDAILLEDLTRVANGVQSRIEMCTNWTETASGVWEGGFPVQVNGVAFETNRYTNVKNYRIAATNGAFVETLIRKPKEGWRTNTVTRFVANEPGFSHVNTLVAFTNTPSIDVVSAGTINPIGLIRADFSLAAEWRWAGRTHTNRVTVPRMIVLYNKN